MKQSKVRKPDFSRPLAVTVSEAARLLGRSRKTVYARMKDGTLPLELRIVGKRPMVLMRSIEEVLSL